LHGGMFAAWNEKLKKPNMSSQSGIGLPSMGHLVGDLTQKRQKDSDDFKCKPHNLGVVGE